ncbi:MAG: hypothetical protein Tsb002_04580 [Wenzhouxiangellaceae bacterium]
MSGPVLNDLFKRVLVDRWYQKLQRENPGGKVTLSQLTFHTGLDSRQLKKLLDRPIQCTETDISTEAMLLHRWSRDPNLRDPEHGRPRDLPIYGYSGTFQGLISAVVGRGVTPQTVLERLVQNGNVSVVNEHWVRLLSPDWRVVEEQQNNMLESAAFSITNLVRTINNNLDNYDNHENRWLERYTYSIRLPVDRSAEVRAKLTEILSQQKEENAQILRSFETMDLDRESRVIGIGYYYWEASQSEWSHVLEPGS